MIMIFLLPLFVALVTAYPASVSHEGSLEEGPVISTSSGQVIGHKALWPKDSGVDEYLGIPYAAPPIKELRFMAPKPYKANRTIKADDFVSNLACSWIDTLIMINWAVLDGVSGKIWKHNTIRN
jgi:hypothetical protein